MRFVNEVPFERRCQEAKNIRGKYPDRLPIICEPSRDTTVPAVDKRKFLVPRDLTVGQFLYVIRKRIQLKPSDALFLFVNNSVLPPTCAIMQDVYDSYAQCDGFLYITYSGENTFGGDPAGHRLPRPPGAGTPVTCNVTDAVGAPDTASAPTKAPDKAPDTANAPDVAAAPAPRNN